MNTADSQFNVDPRWENLCLFMLPAGGAVSCESIVLIVMAIHAILSK